jgi:transcription-repair coupling factor (superfamily II helicase)
MNLTAKTFKRWQMYIFAVLLNIHDILQRIARNKSTQELLDALATSRSKKIFMEGVVSSGPAFIAAAVFAQLQKPMLAIMPNAEEALTFKTDIENILAGETVNWIPDSFVKALKISQTHAHKVQERIEALNILGKGKARIHVSYGAAMAEWVAKKDLVDKQAMEFHRGQTLDIDFLMEFLQANGFTLEDFVLEPGQFSVRGGIVDIYSFAHEMPFRIQLNDDEIEKIKKFNTHTQLSETEIEFFTLLPNVQESNEVNESIFEYFDPNTIVFYKDAVLFEEDFKTHYETNLQLYTTSRDLGEKELKHPRMVWQPPGQFATELDKFTQIHWGTVKPKSLRTVVEFKQSLQPSFHRDFAQLGHWIAQNDAAKLSTLVFADNPKQLERIEIILRDLNIQADFIPIYHGLSGGLVDQEAKLALVTEHQLFGKFYMPKSRRKLSGNAALTLRELKNLQPGDFVTHIDHGIGRFSGLEKMEMHGVMQEVVRLVYKDNDLLYVGISSLHKIAKFSSKDGTQPPMHKLGSGKWEKQKIKTKSKVKDIARELIKLYATRKTQKGFQFAPDNYMQVEMEASFFYEDTPDQFKAVEAVKRDMESSSPMDRLVCGDVGFGKTEVAMRSAFKAVCDSKQVAVLVPTTILAQQHYRTFQKRFKGFPVNVDYLNRFKSREAQKETLKDLAAGKVDIIIGTHRLIGKDIKFKDLGLMIIDEEQKFGVAAKDKLKAVKLNVDTLTLTATPIPRTLQFSLMGSRDLSIINTPPPNRQSVHTELHMFNREIIAQAINDEVARGGQVFFVHSRVRDIYELQIMIESICPGVKTTVAHGQMTGEELENNMLRFINGEYEVLLATTIIESGLDIPNANTIIINNAHMFGLSDLHQMRGRVGRSNVKAYCYLLAPGLSGLPDEARKRLRAIEEFSELGSGFQVAMRDLDIRGAGNLLGGEQSGFINEMGFDMYQKILDEAIRELKEDEFSELYTTEEKDIRSRECQVETDYETLISADYVTNITERLSLYTDLAKAENKEDLAQFERSLIDRFGEPIPAVTRELFKIMELKWLGMSMGLEKIALRKRVLKLYFPEDQNAPIFGSHAFAQLMQYVVNNPSRFAMKQTEKVLIMAITNVPKIEDAVVILQELQQENN